MNTSDTQRFHIHRDNVTPQTTFKRDDLLEPFGSSIRQLKTDRDVDIAWRAFRLGLLAAERGNR